MATRPLTDAERSVVESGLDLAAKEAGAERPLTTAQLQDLYDRALARPSEALFAAIGFTFGEMLRHDNPLMWVVCDDDYGTELGLKATDDALNLTIHPLSMIRYRLEDGEQVDIAGLNRDSVQKLNELAVELRSGPTNAGGS